MRAFLGIDLGTSSTKAVVLDQSGQTLAIGSRPYSMQSPQPGYAEQNSTHWWGAVIGAVRDAIDSAKGPQIEGIGLTGQMHGLVLVDGGGTPVRAPIIWPDQRTADSAFRVTEQVSADWVHRHTGMMPTTGLLGLSLAWVRKNEPVEYGRAAQALLPKDYIRFCLTGMFGTDASDASGSLLLDIHSRSWSSKMADVLGVDLELLPALFASTEVAGGLRTEAAHALDLPPGIPVVVGASDQATAASALRLGSMNRISIGMSSGGTVLHAVKRPSSRPPRGVDTLCAADDMWLEMGAVLSAGLSLSWLSRLLNPSDPNGVEDLVAEAASAPPGAKGLVFIPNLRGERAPLPGPSAKASFRGLSYEHERPELIRAVLEGVSFALRDCLEATAGERKGWPEIIGFGGGLKNPFWRQILADVLGVPLGRTSQSEHSAAGAAGLAAQGTGGHVAFDGVPVQYTEPNPGNSTLYEEAFAAYRSLRREPAMAR